MKLKPALRTFLVVSGSVLLLAAQARAVNYYWDSNGTATGLGDASLVWGNTNTKANLSGGNNRSVVTGTFAMDNTVTGTGDTMYFGIAGMSLGTSGSLIGVQTAGVTINTIVFSSSQTNAVTLGTTGNLGAITLGGTTPTIYVNNTADTITTTLGGTAGIRVSGPGTLTLNAASVNPFTGGLTLNSGVTLVEDFANLATPTDLINSGNALTLAAGNLSIKGKSSGSTSQTLGNLTLSAGASSILLNPNGGTATTLNLGTLNTTAAGGSLLVGTAAGAGSGTVAVTTTTNKDATGIYGGRVVFTSDGGATVDWATTTSGASPYTLSAYGGYTAMPLTGGTSSDNDFTSAGGTLSGNLAANTLKITGSATDLELGANTLTLNSGGLLSAGTTAQNITGTAGATRLTAGNASGSYDLIVQQYNTGGLNISAVIGNNGANAVNLVKSGTSTLTLSGANTYTGTTFINAGNLIVSGGSAIADGGSVVLANAAGATFKLNNNETIGNLTGGGFSGGNLDVQGNALTISASNGTFGGLLTGTSSGQIIKQGTGTLTLNNPSGNSFAGTIAVSGGTLQLTTGNNGLSSIAVSSGGAINLANSTTLNINLAATAPYTWGGQIGAVPTATYAIGNAIKLTGAAATISMSAANDTRFAFSGDVTGSNSGNSILNITPGGNSDRTELLFSGVLANGSGGNTLGLTVNLKSSINVSFFNLTGQNTFTGPIAVTTASTLAGSGYLTIGGQSFTSGASGSTRNNAIVGTGYIGGGNYTNTISLGTNTVLDYLSTANQTLGGVISGAGSLLKEGSGTLTLSAANTYSGGSTISTGALVFQNTGAKSASGTHAFAAGTTIGLGVATTGSYFTSTDVDNAFSGTMTGNLSNVTVTATTNVGLDTTAGDFTYASSVSGSPTKGLLKFGSNTLTLSGTSTYTGATTISDGTLSVSTLAAGGTASNIGASTNAAGNLILNGGTLKYTGAAVSTDRLFSLQRSSTIDASGTGAVNFTNTGSMGYNGSTAAKTLTLTGTSTGANTLSALIADNTGATSITKTGTGTWVLANSANSYTGGTTVSAGTLQYASKTALGTGTLTLAGGTKLQKITEEGNFASLAMSNNIALSGGAVEMNVSFSGVKDQWFSGKISGSGGLRVTGDTRAIALTGNNDFTGGVTLDTTSNAWIQIGHANALGTGTLTINATGGNFDRGLGANTNLTSGSGVANNVVINSGATFNLGGFSAAGNVLLSGIISGSGNLNKQDSAATTFILSGANTYTGTTRVTTGTLEVQGSIASSSGITNNAALVFNSASTQSYGNAIGGSGTLAKNGSGTLTLSGASSYTGATNVNDGMLIVNGNISTSLLTTVKSGATLGGSGTVGNLTVDAGGFFSPGNSPGIATVDGDYIQNGTLVSEITGLTAGSQHDQVVVNGTVTLNGSLNISSFTGFTPVNGDLIFILLNDSNDAISGTFAGLAQGAVVGNYLGFDWQISYTGNSGGNNFIGGNDVVLMAIPEPRAALLGGLGLLLLFRRRRS